MRKLREREEKKCFVLYPYNIGFQSRIKMSEISADISPIFRVSGATETIFDI